MQMRRCSASLCGLFVAATAQAQAVDSTAAYASTARSAFQAAGQAATLREALPHLARAAHAWPTQSSYWISLARVGARLSDTAAVREALGALAPMGAGITLLSDTSLHRLAQAPSIRAAFDSLKRSTATVTGGRVVATIADSGVFAEGVDADPRSGALYVGSIAQRTVFEVAANGRVRDLQVSRTKPVGAILGVRVTNDGRHVYATTAGLRMMRGYQPGDSALVAILKIRITDGEVVARWDVPHDGARHLLGDLAIDAHGTVYATDSFAPVIYVLRPGADTLLQVRHPLFRSLQGVAPIPGTSHLVVADYSHGLLRVDVDRQSVVRIADASGTTTLGFDGLVWHDGALVGVQNGVQSPRIARLTLNDDQTRVLQFRVIDRQPEVATEPTIGTIWRGGFVYVANSQWDAYDDDGVRRPGSVLRATTLLCVPLGTVRGQAAAADRKGTRSTASAPPPARACNASDAASP
jgi:hypothetical protein